MSLKALAAAWDYETKDPLEKLVLLCIADHFNDSMGQAWPSVERVSAMCGCSRSTTLRKLKQLEENDIIARQKRFNKTDIIVVNIASMSGCHTDRCHSDTSKPSPGVSERHTNPYNTLTLINNSEKQRSKHFKRKTLSEKQKAFAHRLADGLWGKHKHEGYAFDSILKDVEGFLLSDQSDAAWKSIGNGLPKPI